MRPIGLAVALWGCGGQAAPPPGVTPPAVPVVEEPTPARLEAGEARLARADDEGRIAVWIEARAGERYALVLVAPPPAPLPAAPGPVHAYRAARLDERPESPSALVPMTGCALAPVSVTAPPPVAARPAATVEPGARRTFAVRTGQGTVEVIAEARAVGDVAVVWADTTAARPAELDEDFARSFLADFESIILPRARAIFGHESDVDSDGRIALLFTPLTRSSERSVAYFSRCDLQPDCPGSNRGEVLYLSPPHSIAPPYNTPAAIKEILAHELEHLLHRQPDHAASERTADSMYLLEGFGALAQDVTGLQAGNLYVTRAGLEQIDRVSLIDLLAEGTAYDPERDGALRGAAYLLVRWLYDRAGGDAVGPRGEIVDRGGPSFVRALIGAPRSAAAALAERADLGRLAVELYASWVVPAGASKNPCLSYAPPVTDPATGRPRGADPFASFHGQQLRGAATVPIDELDGKLRAGGAEITTLEAREQGRLGAVFSVDPEAGASLVVVRLP